MHFYLRFLCMAFISLVLIGPSYPLFSLIVFFNHDDGLSSSLFIIFHLPFVFSYRFISLCCSPYYYDYIFFVFFFSFLYPPFLFPLPFPHLRVSFSSISIFRAAPSPAPSPVVIPYSLLKSLFSVQRLFFSLL